MKVFVLKSVQKTKLKHNSYQCAIEKITDNLLRRDFEAVNQSKMECMCSGI